jgi:hypothetical protein
MIDLSAKPATYPADVVYGALGEVFDRVQDAMDAGSTPPDLERSMAAVRRHQRENDADAVDNSLAELAHATVAQLVSRRALNDPRISGR